MAALLKLRQTAAVFALGGVLGLGACFLTPAPPASLRYDCSSDSDCDPTQVCASGLCQQACGADGDEPCEGSVCVNGYCSSVCWLADDECSSPQTCQSITLPVPDEEPPESGICMIPCSADAPCADGQVCFEDLGICLTTCMVPEDCGDGEECLTGFCVPSFGG